MKKTILITFLLLTVLNCKGQETKNGSQKKDTIISQTKTMFYIPIINPNFEKFDFQKTKEEFLKNLKKKGDLQNPDANAYSYYYDEKMDNRIISRYYNETKKEGIIYATETVFYDNSPFAIVKIFYPNGNIKEKGVNIVSGSVFKGLWYYFDEEGKAIKTIDYDKFFQYNWEDIEKYMGENKILMPLGNKNINGKTIISRSYTSVFKDSPNPSKNASTWSITYQEGNNSNQYCEIILDGNTGKLLYRKKYWLSQEGEEVPEPNIEDFTKK